MKWRRVLARAFTPTERRWGGRLEAAMWLASAGLLVVLVAWSAG